MNSIILKLAILLALLFSIEFSEKMSVDYLNAKSPRKTQNARTDSPPRPDGKTKVKPREKNHKKANRMSSAVCARVSN